MSQNKTHALVHNGTPHDEVGYELTDPKVTSGEGRAKCKCGWLSEELGSGAARREAFKRHVADPAFDEPTPDSDEDLIGEAPAKGKTPAKGTTKTATKAAAPKAEKAAPGGLADPGEGGEYVDLTFDVKPKWLWAVLGRYGAYAIAEAVKGVTVSHDDKAMVIRITGNPKRLEPLGDLIYAAWEASNPARKAWKKEDATYRKTIDKKVRGWQTNAGNQERDFSRQFMEAVRDRVAKKPLEDNPGAYAAGQADIEAQVKAARR